VNGVEGDAVVAGEGRCTSRGTTGEEAVFGYLKRKGTAVLLAALKLSRLGLGGVLGASSYGSQA